ncbi:TIGR04222 domain-containing membrane protein [Streptomyces sp. NBC_01591]|uniref:TIGR04222 domain-containing membrane protein n=1 Tax=Streptomyces sp. NBC_01591 TaxID=2975888 RepID=UPI002DD8587F|nr:TIGR04222 domain-containing membrane protein [Streptomyces sp. NBC_01591]WSD71507.1 TIGR04222 domain-containing membrane protein [Streptomyces sp. NBC_01591]
MNTVALLVDLGIVVSSVLLIMGLARARGGVGGSVHDLYEVAFLNGGPGRVVDTALTGMQADGRLAVGGPGIVAVQRAEARDPVERAVLQEHAMAPSGALHTLREAVMRHPAVQEVGDGLAARGLLAAPAASRTWRRWGIAQGLVCVLAVPLTVVATAAQSLSDELSADSPVPFIFKVLPFLITGMLTGFICAGVARGRVTKSGRRAAEAYRVAQAYNPDPAHSVATHGLRALPDPEFQAQLIAAARMQPHGRTAGRRTHAAAASTGASALLLAPVVWCAGTSPGHSSCGSSGDGGSGGGGGGGCSSGSSCGSGSGSGCGGSSGSSCSSSSSSCGGGSSCGS